MIQALAHQGGLAIQNASLYMKLQEDKQDMETDSWSHRMWFWDKRRKRHERKNHR